MMRYATENEKHVSSYSWIREWRKRKRELEKEEKGKKEILRIKYPEYLNSESRGIWV
jgi:hypothetical protein